MSELTFEPNLAIIILAAGSSSRLGQAKQLVKINGKSLIERQCQLALSISSSVYCVIGSESELMIKAVKGLPVKLITNESWRQGMSTSIRVGIKALEESISAVMILLVDQWQLTSSDLRQLIAVSQSNPSCIIQSEFIDSKVSINNELKNEKLTRVAGPPVIFPKCFFTQLREIEGGEGARKIIQQHKSSTIKVSIAHAAADLDTPEQLKLLPT